MPTAMSSQWPGGVSTTPECDAERNGTRPAVLEADLARLRVDFARFTRQPRDFVLQRHPLFGAMNESEWMRWGYLHMDHHLRQFGV